MMLEKVSGSGTKGKLSEVCFYYSLFRLPEKIETHKKHGPIGFLMYLSGE